GRVIIAQEGVNATLEGLRADTEAFLSEFKIDERFRDIEVKRSAGTGKSFPGLSVKVRREIVSTGLSSEEADPRVSTAPKLSPEELRSWYESQRDFVVVDMRNNYEIASGRFKNSVDPDISASRHLPLTVHKLDPLKKKTVVTVCTGGVRCEKMSAYLQHQGFEDVYQLDGGIHSYMQKYPGKDFKGTLYTFDERITMDFGGEREVIGTCRLCGTSSERYVNCANQTCHLHFIACADCSLNGSAYCSDVCRVV
ncbi:MAG: hypothetical protein JWM46_396, partial [Candidatus Kaiserbacteria bacterium]|nr:hypothetical protein [Candidatus Kaiserbacteria bacterium]